MNKEIMEIVYSQCARELFGTLVPKENVERIAPMVVKSLCNENGDGQKYKALVGLELLLCAFDSQGLETVLAGLGERLLVCAKMAPADLQLLREISSEEGNFKQRFDNMSELLIRSVSYLSSEKFRTMENG